MTCSEGEETVVRWDPCTVDRHCRQASFICFGSPYHITWPIGLGINVFPVARPGDESFGLENSIDGMSANVFSIFGWLLRAVLLQATSLPGQSISMTKTNLEWSLIDVTATTTNPLPTHHILPLYQKTKLTDI